MTVCLSGLVSPHEQLCCAVAADLSTSCYNLQSQGSQIICNCVYAPYTISFINIAIFSSTKIEVLSSRIFPSSLSPHWVVLSIHFYYRSSFLSKIYCWEHNISAGFYISSRAGKWVEAKFLDRTYSHAGAEWAWELWVSFSSSNVTGHLWLLYTCTLNIFTCTTVHQPFSTLNLLPLKLTVPLMWVNSTRETLSMPNIFHNC